VGEDAEGEGERVGEEREDNMEASREGERDIAEGIGKSRAGL
jgi:hypothetical protein